MNFVKTALVSVSDKTNLDVLADYFKSNSIKVVSTGGTFTALKKLGVNVIKVSEQTSFPEVMGGRVKTLHPKIHMGILARAGVEEDLSLLKEYGVAPFDLLVVNLYPFSKKKNEGLEGDELVEFIDVGGPSMIRAGAKNFERLITITSPEDYELLSTGKTEDIKVRKALAGKAFKHLSEYDSEVFQWLLSDPSSDQEKTEQDFSVSKGQSEKNKKILRYGENPHQEAGWEFTSSDEGLHQAVILQGKELSFNNLVDLTAAVESLSLFNKPTAVSVKHNNPCGIGSGSEIEEALVSSLEADPMSVFGGIVALNRELSADCALRLSKIFLECVVAPSVSEEAKSILASKKNLRVLEWAQVRKGFRPIADTKRVSGGFVVQTPDPMQDEFSEWKQVSGAAPDAKTINALEFSWKTVGRLKSNAIAVCGENQTLGLGMGQVNRVDAVKSAIDRWNAFHPQKEGPIVLSSDAFFPFSDSIELIAKEGIKWVVQPGGSIKDADVIKRAKDLGVGMFFTGKRHFLH